MTTAYIGVGSNLGDRSRLIRQGKKLLKGIKGIQWLQESSVYETEPLGGPPQGKYLNQVWEVETELSADSLMECLIQIEKSLGRVRSVSNAPRTLDLDLLAFGDARSQTQTVTVPHPRMHERDFVLRPLTEINPNWVHPVYGKSARDLLEDALARR